MGSDPVWALEETGTGIISLWRSDLRSARSESRSAGGQSRGSVDDTILLRARIRKSLAQR